MHSTTSPFSLQLRREPVARGLHRIPILLLLLFMGGAAAAAALKQEGRNEWVCVPPVCRSPRQWLITYTACRLPETSRQTSLMCGLHVYRWTEDVRPAPRPQTMCWSCAHTVQACYHCVCCQQTDTGPSLHAVSRACERECVCVSKEAQQYTNQHHAPCARRWPKSRETP